MEKLSALMDGELDEHEARRKLALLNEQPELQRLWATYHVIGDAMRGEHLLSGRFNGHLARRLAQEPTVLAPQRRPAKKLITYALSAAASLSAVAMVAWVALSTGSVTTALQSQVAQAPAVTPANVARPQVVSLPSDGRLNEYILAHQGFSPSTAIQGVTPYIRSVAAQRPAKSR
jgi:sigma-E factor negative regulatory protein RseA